MHVSSNGELLAGWVRDARRRSLELYADLTPEQRLGPLLAIVNPPQWELGHVAWFGEHWVLRTARGQPPISPGDDPLYDSARVPHDDRWSLPLRGWEETRAHLAEVERRVVDGLSGREPTADEDYFVRLAVFHEDMHGEAFLYTRQTLGYAPPRVTGMSAAPAGGGPLSGDARVPGGRFALGAVEGADPFVFDNEKWAHEVEVAPFSIARAPVTEAEMAGFVDDGGYRREDLWSAEGWRWREREGATCPVYWRRDAGAWQVRAFDRWRPLAPHRPVVHVAWFEAEAYCRWAGRRLPTEAEWEMAAAGEPDGAGGLVRGRKRRFPWGDQAPTPARANLDLRHDGPLEVGALPDGDSAFGCRQMFGNVWEWTSTDFAPYPGFVVDPYAEYSAPWFGDHKVLRGGCYVTRARLLRNTWRNFYQPHRRDVLGGFRTCAPG
jgi:gamma-glutamyl hercynylcysteine S-oxide synthase